MCVTNRHNFSTRTQKSWSQARQSHAGARTWTANKRIQTHGILAIKHGNQL